MVCVPAGWAHAVLNVRPSVEVVRSTELADAVVAHQLLSKTLKSGATDYVRPADGDDCGGAAAVHP